MNRVVSLRTECIYFGLLFCFCHVTVTRKGLSVCTQTGNSLQVSLRDLTGSGYRPLHWESHGQGVFSLYVCYVSMTTHITSRANTADL